MVMFCENSLNERLGRDSYEEFVVQTLCTCRGDELTGTRVVHSVGRSVTRPAAANGGCPIAEIANNRRTLSALSARRFSFVYFINAIEGDRK